MPCSSDDVAALPMIPPLPSESESQANIGSTMVPKRMKLRDQRRAEYHTRERNAFRTSPA